MLMLKEEQRAETERRIARNKGKKNSFKCIQSVFYSQSASSNMKRNEQEEKQKKIAKIMHFCECMMMMMMMLLMSLFYFILYTSIPRIKRKKMNWKEKYNKNIACACVFVAFAQSRFTHPHTTTNHPSIHAQSKREAKKTFLFLF